MNTWQLLGSVCAAAVLVSASAAQAQGEPAAGLPVQNSMAQTGPDAAAEASVDTSAADDADIVVSASRIDRAGYTAPSPTTIISTELLEQRAAVNVADVLNEVPSFRRSATPQNSGIGNSGQNTVDLRGLNTLRTLVLFDRLRLPSVTLPISTTGGVPDLNIIPTALINRIDVVTGGASAAYGSNAVAGVVNLQLNTRLEGIKATAQYGVTRYNDAQDIFSSVAGGTSFAGGKGHAVFGMEYHRNEGTGLFNLKRDWGRRNFGVISLTGRAADVPANIVSENVGFGTLTTGGLIAPVGTNPAALRNLQFVVGANGAVTTAPFTPGDFQGQAGASMIGGTNVENYNVLRAESRRYNMLGNITYAVTDDVEFWLQGLYSSGVTNNISNQRRDAQPGGVGPYLTFRPDNFYLQQALTPAQRALVPAAGLSIGYLGNDFGPALIESRIKTSRGATGLRGILGGWRWDASVQYSRNVGIQNFTNNSINANFRNAVDAVQVTAANRGTSGLPIGSIACRSTLTSPTNGCVPINILGEASFTPEAYAYSFGTGRGKTVTTLAEAAANVSGEPFSIWAGPVSVGVGIEARRETLRTDVDPISEAGGFNARSFRGLAKARESVVEVYAETIIPLIKDASFTRSLDLNGAVRYTDYSISGSVTTWKGGVTWKPIDDILFRATLSRDIRAPTLAELYTPSTVLVPAPQTTSSSDARPAFRNTSYSFTSLVGGNINLRPEIGNTLTLGAVLQPRFLPRLQFSADFFRIKVSNAIGSTAAATVLQNCLGTGVAAANNPFCDLLTFENNDRVNGRVLSAIGNSTNFAEFKTKGIDFALTYIQPLSEIGDSLPGRLSFNAQATYVMEYRASTDISALYPNGVNRAGQTGTGFGGTGVPKWVGNGNLDYQAGDFGVNLQVRYISRGKQSTALIGPDESGYSPTLFNSINNNIIPAATYVNVGTRHKIGSDKVSGEVFFVVNNLFDRDPPITGLGNNAYYELLGRSYKGGIRFNF